MGQASTANPAPSAAGGASPGNKKRSSIRSGAGQFWAAAVGAPLLAFVVGAWLMAFLPVHGEWAYVLGAQAIVPCWVALACILPLSRSGRHAFGYCAIPTLAFGLMLLLRAFP